MRLANECVNRNFILFSPYYIKEKQDHGKKKGSDKTKRKVQGKYGVRFHPRAEAAGVSRELC